jgi:hypothetical protein
MLVRIDGANRSNELTDLGKGLSSLGETISKERPDMSHLLTLCIRSVNARGDRCFGAHLGVIA